MYIANNLLAMNTWRQLQKNNKSLSTTTERLSSGYRINRAGDDAAGLAISEKMRAQIRGLTMAAKNTQDAISLIQTAEGALQESHNVLQRMRELAVQAASDTNETTIDRGALELEFQQLKKEIDDTAAKTRFNDQTLLDGSLARAKTATTVMTSLVQANPGSAVISADGLTEGDYTITAGYAAKGSVSTVEKPPVMTFVSGLTDTATHGITLESVELSSVNGIEDWLGIDLENILSIGGSFTPATGTMIETITLNSLSYDFENHICIFPLSIIPVTLTDSNNVMLIHDGMSYVPIHIENGTYTTTQGLADAMNAAVERFNQEKGAFLEAPASVNSDGRLIWDNNKVSDGGIGTDRAGTFLLDLENNDKIKGPTLSTGEVTQAEFNSSKQLVFTDGTRAITMKFSGTLTGGSPFKKFEAFFSDLIHSAKKFYTATNAEVTYDPPKAYYEISLNGDTVKVFDGDTSVSVGGASINFGSALSVPETGGDASALDALLGDKAFSITRTTVTTGSPGGRPLVIQTGANQGDELAINIEAMNATVLGIGNSTIADRPSASQAITEVNDAINRVSAQRAALGALQNRLTHKVQSLEVSAENLQAAESRIRDADMAKEMTAFTRLQILTQAGQAMLSQANALPQQVLSLLQ